MNDGALETEMGMDLMKHECWMGDGKMVGEIGLTDGHACRNIVEWVSVM